MVARPTVLIVDDEPNVVEGLGVVLRSEPYTVLTATSGRQALDLLERQSVDVIVTDEEMPGMRGSELLAQVRKLYPETMRLVLTGQASVHSAIRSINEAAVHRYLTKPCPPAVLKSAIAEAVQAKARLAVHARLVEVAREQSRLLAEEGTLSGPVRAPGAAPPPRGFSEEALQALSLREREVLELLAQGRRVSQIAQSLFISGHTVRNHVKAIFRKLDVHSQVEIVQRARG
jgi:two-component system, probable response regulator PhcQ